MIRKYTRASTVVPVLAAALLGSFLPRLSLAAAHDYRFELVDKPQATSDGKSVISVRLVHLPDNKPVTDAVIFERRADMGPAGMPTMTAPINAVSPAPGGVSRFEVNPGMTGPWAITLAAKVQGEAETVRTSITVELAK